MCLKCYKESRADPDAEPYRPRSVAGSTEPPSTSTTPVERSNWKRRRFLQATGVAAGASAVLGTQADRATASNIDCDVADDWVPSANHSARESSIDWIVIHVTAGEYQGALDTLTSDGTDVSSHYLIKNYDATPGPSAGHIDQLVSHDRRAWHARAIANDRSIGIEHEWTSERGGISDACYAASADLVQCIADMHNIPLDFYTDETCIQNEPGGIIGHTHVPDGSCDSYHHDGRTCPGPDWDMDHFESIVTDGGGGGGGGGGGDFADGDDVVTTGDVNGREGPGLDYDVDTVLTSGTSGEIMNGPEDADGITWWGVHAPSENAWVWVSENYLDHA